MVKIEYWECPNCNCKVYLGDERWRKPCGQSNEKDHFDSLAGPLQSFDKAIQSITKERGQTYGHPGKNFSDIAKLWEVVLGTSISPLQVAQCMRMVKEARLIATPDHLDSLVDIVGYTRTSVMCIDKE